MRRIQLRSAPAQKLRPAPSSTTARTSGSSSSPMKIPVNRAISVSSNALCTSGRFSVTIATALRIVTSQGSTGEAVLLAALLAVLLTILLAVFVGVLRGM